MHPEYVRRSMDRIISSSCDLCRRRETPKIRRPPLLPAGAFRGLSADQLNASAYPHPRQKAARTCEDAVGEVRIVHREMNAGSEAKCQQEMEVCITGGGSAPRASTPLKR